MGDRAYIISKERSFKQVSLSKRIVDGLTQFNSSGFRDSPSYDMKFVKVLLVSLIGIENIAKNELDEFCLDFLKGMSIIFHEVFLLINY